MLQEHTQHPMPSFGDYRSQQDWPHVLSLVQLFPVLIQMFAWSVYDSPYPVPTHVCMRAFVSKAAVYCLTTCSGLCKYVCKQLNSKHAHYTDNM